jgi:hypothetical protein
MLLDVQQSSGPHYNTTDQACQTAQHASARPPQADVMHSLRAGSAPDPASEHIGPRVAKHYQILITLGHRAHLTRKRKLQRLQHCDGAYSYATEHVFGQVQCAGKCTMRLNFGSSMPWYATLRQRVPDSSCQRLAAVLLDLSCLLNTCAEAAHE